MGAVVQNIHMKRQGEDSRPDSEAQGSSPSVAGRSEPPSPPSDTALLRALEVAITQSATDKTGGLRFSDLPAASPLPGALPREPSQFAGVASRRAIRAEPPELSRRLQTLKEQVLLRDAAINATSTHFLITRTGPQGSEIVFVNHALCAEYGYAPAELIGRSAEILAPSDLNPSAVQKIRDAVVQGTSLRLQLRSRRKDGSTFISGITIRPIRDVIQDKTYSVAVGANITAAIAERESKQRLQEQLVAELRERERMGMELRLAQKLESVGRLAAGIAHEINTPIQFVGDSLYFLKSAVADLQQLVEVYRGAVESLARGENPGPLRAQLKEVDGKFDKGFLDKEIPAAFERTQEGIERVASIVRAMKEFAHPDTTERSPTDINRAIETTLLVARNEYKYCANVETEFTELPSVMCNVGELNQVFLNLIVNAAHAIESAGRDERSGVIRIRTVPEGKWVRIEIGDNGCGIPQENLERIFDPFFTTKEVGKGTGQGLAIARSIIVERHGGEFNVESEVGQGTHMILRLPVGGPVARGQS